MRIFCDGFWFTSPNTYNPDQYLEMGENKQLPRPMHIVLENINKFHQHIDFVFYATADTFDVKSEDGETDELKWFTVDEIKELEDAPENAKVLSIEAIELFKDLN